MFWHADTLGSVRLRSAARRAAATAALIAVALIAVALGAAATANAAAAADTRAHPSKEDGPECKDPICYSASKVDAERNHIVMQNIDITDTTRGTTRIKADLAEAAGLDLGNSNWVLTGHVQVFMPQGQLRADKATVQFANKRIASMTAEGVPAEFERAPGPAGGGTGGGENARGHARSITYDTERNELQLNGDSWLTDGCNEINSQHILYDIVRQRVQAAAQPGDSARVSGTIRARSPTPCGQEPRRP